LPPLLLPLSWHLSLSLSLPPPFPLFLFQPGTISLFEWHLTQQQHAAAVAKSRFLRADSSVLICEDMTEYLTVAVILLKLCLFLRAVALELALASAAPRKKKKKKASLLGHRNVMSSIPDEASSSSSLAQPKRRGGGWGMRTLQINTHGTGCNFKKRRLNLHMKIN
jgi:hypothetical protein